MSKLGNNKFEVRVVLCYLVGIIASGIITSIWLALVMDWVISLLFISMWYFAFLIMPFGMNTKSREEVKRIRQGEKISNYIRER